MFHYYFIHRDCTPKIPSRLKKELMLIKPISLRSSVLLKSGRLKRESMLFWVIIFRTHRLLWIDLNIKRF